MINFDRTTFALLLGILGGVLLIVSAFIQYYDKRQSDIETLEAKVDAKKSSIEAKKNADSLLTAQKQIITLQQKTNHTTSEIANKASELAESYKRNATLQEEFKNQITGGNTIPTLCIWATQFSSYKNDPRGSSIQIEFIVKNTGKYPLNDVKITINDALGVIMAIKFVVERSNSIGAMTLKPQTKSSKEVYNEWQPVKIIDVGSLQVGDQFEAYTSVIPNFRPDFFQTPGWGEFNYPVNIKWNSGTLVYNIKLKWSPNKLELKKALVALNGKELPEGSHLSFSYTQ